MKRGDLVAILDPKTSYATKGRPAVVVQETRFIGAVESRTVCPLTSTLADAPTIRPRIVPSHGNALNKPSEVEVDKVLTLPADRIGAVFGRLSGPDMARVDDALRLWLAL
jgi:mRNA interferase MazF